MVVLIPPLLAWSSISFYNISVLKLRIYSIFFLRFISLKAVGVSR
jgi:hypothetical protein